MGSDLVRYSITSTSHPPIILAGSSGTQWIVYHGAEPCFYFANLNGCLGADRYRAFIANTSSDIYGLFFHEHPGQRHRIVQLG